MQELKTKALRICQDQPIDFLIKQLDSYDMKSSVEDLKENDQKGEVRLALMRHVNKVIAYSGTDLDQFILHFS